jgi:GTP diphosphokinase / guanosine-3',5'-bis(diphosphate) 3'-diphosphatase
LLGTFLLEEKSADLVLKGRGLSFVLSDCTWIWKSDSATNIVHQRTGGEMLEKRVVMASETPPFRQPQLSEMLSVFEDRLSIYASSVLKDSLVLLSEWGMSERTKAAAVAYSLFPNCDYFDGETVERALKLKGIDRIQVDPPAASQGGEGRNHSSRISKLRKLFLLAYTDLELALVYVSILSARARRIRELKSENAAILAAEIEAAWPLLGLCGLWKLGREIADISLEVLNRKAWNMLTQRQATIEAEQRWYYEILVNTLASKMKAESIRGDVRIHEYSRSGIYRRMRRGELIEDLLRQLRIDVMAATEKDCYEIENLISRPVALVPEWSSEDHKTKNLIRKSKPNGYRAIVKTVVYDSPKEGSGRVSVEFRILTAEMNAVNSLGVIAANFTALTPLTIPGAWWHDEESVGFVQSHPVDKPTEKIYVFSPRGQVFHDLPKESTPVDYAYLVHSELAHRCRSFWVNGEPVRYDDKLQNGSIVEVKTDPESLGPAEEWLSIVKTPNAKKHIRLALNRMSSPANKGRRIVDKILVREFKAYQLPSPHPKVIDQYLEAVAREFGLPSSESLFALVSTNTSTSTPSPSPDQIVSRFIQTQLSEHIIRVDKGPLGVAHSRIRFAQCTHDKELCRVTPGSPITGKLIEKINYLSELVVYRKDCPNSPSPAKAIELGWRGVGRIGQSVRVTIRAVDTSRLLNEVLQCVYDLYDEGVYLQEIQASVGNDQAAHIELKITSRADGLVSKLQKNFNGLLDAGKILFADILSLTPVEQVLLARGDEISNPYTRNPVQDIRLFKGRQKQIEKVVSSLNANKNLLIVYGASRVGKTSFLYHLNNHILLRDTFFPVLVSHISTYTENGFWRTVARRIQKSVSSVYGAPAASYLQRLSFDDEGSEAYENLCRSISKTREVLENRKLIILIDEMTSLDLHWTDKEAAKRVVSQLKAIVEESQDVTFILSVHDTLYKTTLPTDTITHPLLSNGISIPLGHLNNESAEKLIREPLSSQVMYNPGAINKILTLTAGHPFYLQIILYEIISHLRDQDEKTVTLDLIEAITPTVIAEGDYIFAQFLQMPDAIKRAVMSAVAFIAGDDGLGAAFEEIWDQLKTLNFAMNKMELQNHLQELCAVDILERLEHKGFEKYGIRIPLFHKAIRSGLLRVNPTSPC